MSSYMEDACKELGFTEALESLDKAQLLQLRTLLMQWRKNVTAEIAERRKQLPSRRFSSWRKHCEYDLEVRRAIEVALKDITTQLLLWRKADRRQLRLPL
jgi:hypothetical protein